MVQNIKEVKLELSVTLLVSPFILERILVRLVMLVQPSQIIKNLLTRLEPIEITAQIISITTYTKVTIAVLMRCRLRSWQQNFLTLKE